VRTLVETKVLVGERGAYRMTKAPEVWSIPAAAQAILAARIDRLPPEDKRLLQTASVIGKDVPFTLLQAIAEVPENNLCRGLTHLQAAEFLYETRLFPDIEYTFKHALIHEVAYASLLQDRRRALHARIVEAIEEGVSCLEQALSAYEGAGIGFRHSLNVAQLGEAYLLADQVENARGCADRAVMLARGRGERGNEAWALRLLGEIASHHAGSDVAAATAHYGAAMPLASELKMRPLVAHCHLGLGRLYWRTDKRDQAQERLNTATAMYGEMGMTYWLEKLKKGAHTRMTAGP